MSAPGLEALEIRIDELESRLAFQDDLIESLNEVISRQDAEMGRIRLQLRDLAGKLADLSEAGSGPAHPVDHEVPPHY